MTTRRVVRYQRPALYPAQADAIFHPARYVVIEAATKTGKTQGCIVWLHEQAALGPGAGAAYWWVAPIRPQAKIAFERLCRMLPAGTFRAHKTDLTVTLANGAVVWFKSGHDPDALFGEDVYAAVVDEATRVKAESWTAIRSTLTSTGGPARIIGNVKGRKNWAYQLARRAEQGELAMHHAKLTAYDAVGWLRHMTREEIADARRMMPEQPFNELYLAIPGDDGSNPFGRQAIVECTRDVKDGSPPVTFGWDLARGGRVGADWTVGLGLDSDRNTVAFDRFQGPWAMQRRRIMRLTGIVPALVDATGQGGPVVERLQEDGGGNYSAFTFSETSRQRILEGVAIRIGERSVTFPAEVAAELDDFEYVYTAGGKVSYRAPEGMHDDCVMALALAIEHWQPGMSFGAAWLDDLDLDSDEGDLSDEADAFVG